MELSYDEDDGQRKRQRSEELQEPVQFKRVLDELKNNLCIIEDVGEIINFLSGKHSLHMLSEFTKLSTTYRSNKGTISRLFSQIPGFGMDVDCNGMITSIHIRDEAGVVYRAREELVDKMLSYSLLEAHSCTIAFPLSEDHKEFIFLPRFSSNLSVRLTEGNPDVVRAIIGHYASGVRQVVYHQPALEELLRNEKLAPSNWSGVVRAWLRVSTNGENPITEVPSDEELFGSQVSGDLQSLYQALRSMRISGTNFYDRLQILGNIGYSDHAAIHLKVGSLVTSDIYLQGATLKSGAIKRGPSFGDRVPVSQLSDNDYVIIDESGVSRRLFAQVRNRSFLEEKVIRFREIPPDGLMNVRFEVKPDQIIRYADFKKFMSMIQKSSDEQRGQTKRSAAVGLSF